MQRHTILYLKSKFTPYISSDLSNLFVLEHNIGCRPRLLILLERKKRNAPRTGNRTVTLNNEEKNVENRIRINADVHPNVLTLGEGQDPNRRKEHAEHILLH